MNIALIGAECEENLALRYIHAALEHDGHAVRLIAFNRQREMKTVALQLAQSGAELAGFSMVFTYRAAEFAQLAQQCRESGYRGHLVAGGHFAAFNAEALLRDVQAFDSVAVGEGEAIMCNLAAHLAALASVPGLIWRDADGRIHRNAPTEKPAVLDSLPFPTRLEPPDAYLGLPIANILSSRGCTHACDFCSIAAWHKLCGGPRFRLRDPAAIAEELTGLYRRGYRIFNFHDDNFFLGDKSQSMRRFWRLRGELQARGAGRIAFAVKSRPDTVDEELFGSLKEWGLFRVFLGIEAGTSESLKWLGRRQTLEHNLRALDIVNRLDLHACFNLLLLNPDSTLEDFRANVAFLRVNAANPMNFCRTEVYAGTPLETRLRREGRLSGDYWGYGYCIGDARAQTAFELMHQGLQGRHYGDRCVQHLTMRVDYERQLLDHFWNCAPLLREHAKDFVRRVNLNSCEYLEMIAEAAHAGFKSRKQQEAFAHQLSARVGRDNQRFTVEGSHLIAEIEQASQPRKRQSSLWQTEAAAVLVSSLTLLSATSCTTRFSETKTVPYILNSDIQKQLMQHKVLPTILPFLSTNKPVYIRAAFGGSGQCLLVKAEEQGHAILVPKHTLKLLFMPDLKDRTCEAAFNLDEMKALRVSIESTSTDTFKRSLMELVPFHLACVFDSPADVDLIIKYNNKGHLASVIISKVEPSLKPDIVSRIQKSLKASLSGKVDEPWLFDRTWSIHIPAATILRCQGSMSHTSEMAPVPPAPQTDFRRKF